MASTFLFSRSFKIKAKAAPKVYPPPVITLYVRKGVAELIDSMALAAVLPMQPKAHIVMTTLTTVGYRSMPTKKAVTVGPMLRKV